MLPRTDEFKLLTLQLWPGARGKHSLMLVSNPAIAWEIARGTKTVLRKRLRQLRLWHYRRNPLEQSARELAGAFLNEAARLEVPSPPVTSEAR